MTFVLCVYSEKGSAHRCTIAQAESIQQLNVVLMSLLFYPKYIYCGYATIAFSFSFKKLPFCSGNNVTTPSSELCADCQFEKVIKFIFSDVWKKTTLIAFSPAELLYYCYDVFCWSFVYIEIISNYLHNHVWARLLEITIICI